jgi:hypothetical protein
MAEEHFNPMDYPLALTRPAHLTATSAWVQHTPFAMALVEMCRPDVIVELGTHRGDSYCAFCQAVLTLKLPTRCTAIDTWQGDPHAGEYGADVLAQLRQFHDPHFAGFSTLLQSTFDDAVGKFAHGSIDLLHIDGFHQYEAAKHDFETWRPKLSGRGVVLFHDTQVREKDYGVWKLWEELAGQFPSLEFRHGFGLGVLAIGPEVPPALARFLAIANAQREQVLGYFEFLGISVEILRQWRVLVGNTCNIQAMLNEHRRLTSQPTSQPADLSKAFEMSFQFAQLTFEDVRSLVLADLARRGIKPS